jgi:hypothetical protein
MPHITVYYKMHVLAGHHRQPRNHSSDVRLAPRAGSDVPNPGNYIPPFFAQLPYDLGGPGLATLLFWNVTDGTHGQVFPPTPFNQTVAENPLTITAWYFPVTGPGVGRPGIISDALSAALGRFIDDPLVTVTSNPAQTNDAAVTANANVSGFVQTDFERQLRASLTVMSSSEPFGRWILNDAAMPLDDATLTVSKGASGIAIAIYQTSVLRPTPPGVGKPDRVARP